MGNMIFCGMPMSGKTTIGERVAKQMGWAFADTDWLIEKAYVEKKGGQRPLTCRQIFQQEGEEFFRALEKEQIYSLQGWQNTVFAVGGGSLCDPENCLFLKAMGCLIYLKTSLSTLWERMEIKGVPAFLDPQDPRKSFEDLALRRFPLYEASADVIIEADRLGIEEIVKIALKKVNNA